MILIFVAAFSGGILRGLVGFLKYQFSYKEAKFRPMYFFGTMFLSGVIGLLAALAVKEIGFTILGGFSKTLAFIVGYAGGDFIENIYKIIIKKSSFSEDLNKKR